MGGICQNMFFVYFLNLTHEIYKHLATFQMKKNLQFKKKIHLNTKWTYYNDSMTA